MWLNEYAVAAGKGILAHIDAVFPQPVELAGKMRSVPEQPAQAEVNLLYVVQWKTVGLYVAIVQKFTAEDECVLKSHRDASLCEFAESFSIIVQFSAKFNRK